MTSWTLIRLYVKEGKLRAQLQRTATLPNGREGNLTHTTELGLWADWHDKTMADITAALAAKLMPADTPMPTSWTVPTPIPEAK